MNLPNEGETEEGNFHTVFRSEKASYHKKRYLARNTENRCLRWHRLKTRKKSLRRTCKSLHELGKTIFLPAGRNNLKIKVQKYSFILYTIEFSRIHFQFF